jgi:hypothetical protein
VVKVPNDKKQRILKDKDPAEAMNQILSEEKFLLTGATAFLGFQFSIVFNQNFTQLSGLVKYTHITSLYLIGIAVILLFMPVAYHRIAAKGVHSDNQPVIAHYIFKSAMAVFALGVSLEIFSAMKVATQNSVIALALSTFTLLLYLIFWFVMPIYLRKNID